MELSVVIPTYNGLDLLKENLPSLIKNFEIHKKSEIIIIDNNSTDATESFIKNLPLQYKKLDKNYGYSGAINAGVMIAKNNLVLLLNNDCSISKLDIERMCQFIISHRDLVATQPVVYDTTGTIENIGYIVDLPIAKAREIKDLSYNFEGAPRLFHDNYIYGLSAACLLISKEAFVKIGMFDQSFHSYLEDVDLFIRFAKKGYQYLPCISAKAIHKHMATSKQMKGYKQKHDLINWIRIIGKNYPPLYIMTHIHSLCIERLRNLKGYLWAIMN